MDRSYSFWRNIVFHAPGRVLLLKDCKPLDTHLAQRRPILDRARDVFDSLLQEELRAGPKTYFLSFAGFQLDLSVASRSCSFAFLLRCLLELFLKGTNNLQDISQFNAQKHLINLIVKLVKKTCFPRLSSH